MKLLFDFHNSILENDASRIIPEIKPHPQLTAIEQFAVYADGYRIRLIHAIRSDYPATLDWLGDKVFDKFANAYIEEHPPTSYNLDFYPHKFAEFLHYKCKDQCANQIAMLEAAIAEVFMLPESVPLSSEDLKFLSAEDFGENKFKLRTASKLLAFDYNINIWFTEVRAAKNPSKPQKEPSWLLVLRHNNEVQRYYLNKQQFLLLNNIRNSENLSDALDSAIKENSSDAVYIASNLQNWFANWTEGGVFTLETVS